MVVLLTIVAKKDYNIREMKWTKEQQEKFFAENPEFMSEYPISRDMIHLLRDPMYRGLIRKIKKYETGEREKY